MRVKKFFASTSREVLKQVREALGDEAVILSNRSVSGGVEILAIAEHDMADIVGSGSAAASQAPAKEIEVRSMLQGGENAFGIKKKERKVQHALPIAAAAAVGKPATSPRATPAAAPSEALSEEIKSMRNLIEQRLSTPAAKADLLRRVERMKEAAQAYREALELATNPAERRYLERRLAQTLG